MMNLNATYSISQFQFQFFNFNLSSYFSNVFTNGETLYITIKIQYINSIINLACTLQNTHAEHDINGYIKLL